MQIFYADDTYAKATKEDQQPTIHLFGGVVVDRETETKIIDCIRAVKSAYTHPNLPIKWNFRDTVIRDKFSQFKRDSDYKKMLAASREWRLEIFRRVRALDFTVLIACIKSASIDKAVLKKVRDDLNSYCFENVLMRIGIDAKERGGHWQCVLDWPPDGNSKPFDAGYYRLYHYGKASSPRPSICGPLEKLGFSHSLHFTRCNHSPMMQFADLILGATKDHIECQVQGRGSCVGTEAVELFYNHFRNLNGEIPKYGVIASTGNASLSATVAQIFKKKAAGKQP